MSRDNKKKTYFDENFFNDDLDSKDNTADFLKSDLPSQRSTEKGGSDKHVVKGKGTNYIQNYKSSVKNTGYSDLLKKKMQPQTNFLTNNHQNIKISHSPDINNHSGMNTINYEGNYVPEASLRELSEASHSPGKHKLVDALQNIDKNMFVKISKKEHKQKIENFQVRRASNIREKQKNSLTSLNNILNSNVNKGSKQNIAIVNKAEAPKDTQQEKEYLDERNIPSEKSSKLNTANNSKSKLFQRNQKASQGTNKFNENVSENNNDTADEIQLKNSRNISQQTNVIVSSDSKKDNLIPPQSKIPHQQNLSHNTSFHNDLPELKETSGTNVYKRPTRNHKRDASQDVSETKHNRMNRTAEVSIEKTNDNIFGRSAKQLEERPVAEIEVVTSGPKDLTEFHIKEHNAESQKHLENVNSVASLTKISKQASPVLEHKLEISTITDHPRTGFPFIYDESIKDHASEEKEINVDRLLLINKRFLEIAQLHSEERINLKSNITVGLACKVSNDVFSEIKSEADKEFFDLMSKNRELQDKQEELIKENATLKENLIKSSQYGSDKSVAELSATIKDLQKYILKLEKENVVLKNEFTNNIKAKNGLLKKFNDDLVDYQRLTTNFMEKFSELEEEEE